MIRTIFTASCLLWANFLIILGILTHIDALQQVGFIALVPTLWGVMILLMRWTDANRRPRVRVIKRADFSRA